MNVLLFLIKTVNIKKHYDSELFTFASFIRNLFLFLCFSWDTLLFLAVFYLTPLLPMKKHAAVISVLVSAFALLFGMQSLFLPSYAAEN